MLNDTGTINSTNELQEPIDIPIRNDIIAEDDTNKKIDYMSIKPIDDTIILNKKEIRHEETKKPENDAIVPFRVRSRQNDRKKKNANTTTISDSLLKNNNKYENIDKSVQNTLQKRTISHLEDKMEKRRNTQSPSIIPSDPTTNTEIMFKETYTSSLVQPEVSITGSIHSKNLERQKKNIRTTVTMDFQPDLCKDYKETGICGWGDKCKFLHDRGEYISSADVEKQWIKRMEDAKKQAKASILEKKQSSNDECGLCHNKLQNPVCTECKHYFCEECLQRILYSSTKCPICSHETHGIYTHISLFIQNKRQSVGDSDTE